MNQHFTHSTTPLPRPPAESYTFSAKEKDSETGLSYFGSRYYSSDLSIWLSVDPMSDKYASLSPYVYCADNPVRCVDPNGETIVGTDDNAVSYTYDEQGNVVWSKNTSADAMRIGNAMLKTETGKEQLDKLIASPTKVTFQIADRNENPSVMGDSQYKSSMDYDGIEPPSSATILIYEGSIREYLSSYEIQDGTLNMGTYWASQDITNGVENYIAAVVGHEAEHIVSRENRIASAIYKNNPTKYNLWLRELVPDIKKTRILWETYLK